VLVAAPAGPAGPATAQVPAGTLTGVVLDSLTGAPVPYALIIAGDGRRLFASDAGRFTLVGLPGGRLDLRIQQIGYRGTTVTLLPAGEGRGSEGSLVIRLLRQPLVLPELMVRAPDCQAPGRDGATGTLLDEAFRNAERLLTLQKDYPYLSRIEEISRVRDNHGTLLEEKIDTILFDSRALSGYRRGRVLGRAGGRSGRESATYFSPADLAGKEFRDHHCFWFAGSDQADGVPAYRIAFRPLRSVRSVDWEGSLVVDSASLHLLRSEAHLVNLPENGTGFRQAGCLVMYIQVVPTLVHESQALCTTIPRSVPPIARVQRWTLLEHRFLGRRPDPGG
jgi:hypothetical protein